MRIKKFELKREFLDEFVGKEPEFGFNGLGKFTFMRTYSRIKENGKNEAFWEVVTRVVNGTFTIIKKHMISNGLPWDESAMRDLARTMYRKIFAFKMTPPGRGFWAMGSRLTEEDDMFAALQNCAFTSTKDDFIVGDVAKPFRFLMDLSMLGVGVGFDTRGANVRVPVKGPMEHQEEFVIHDSREGWVDSVGYLIDSYVKGGPEPVFDYGHIRAAGEPIKGFGGVSSGPEPLRELHEGIRSVLARREGKTFDVRSIVDIMNMIGRCVIAGNVRRCLPEGTLVHTSEGLFPIEEVKPGMSVKTSEGSVEVTEMVDQGKQEIVEIDSQLGTFKCTPDHRVAVLTAVGTYEWKQAQELCEGDRLVFVDEVSPGTDTEFPGWSYDKPLNSTTCTDITVPELDTDSAWFMGVFHGDGYVYPNFGADENNGNGGFNAYTSIACDSTHKTMIERVKKQMERFGVNLNIQGSRSEDRSTKVRAQSKQLTWYLAQFKQANTEIKVPNFILKGHPEIRAGYLAGLFDADGSAKDRPTVAVSSVYKSFLEEVQAVYASIGIPTRLRLQRSAKGNWQALYHLQLVGEKAISQFEELVAPYSDKYFNSSKTSRSSYDYSFPSEWMQDTATKGVGASRSWCKKNKNKTVATHEDLDGVTVNLVPVKVNEVRHTGEVVHTYDISVPDAKEFVAGPGLLVHNTAEIAFGDPGDTEFLNLKNYDENPERQAYGWASNNSIFAQVGQEYYAPANRIQDNGEPGFAWLENMRKYGRMGDPANWDDAKAQGGNPCLEQTLEDKEMCTLVEVFLDNADDLNDFKQNLGIAFLYAKAVTLTQTHWTESNEVMLKNRRIGTSVTGTAQFIANNSVGKLNHWLDEGYEAVQEYDEHLSEMFGVPRSIKTTSVKPSGTVSLVAGSTPGMHWPEARNYIRRVRVSKNSPLIEPLREAGHHVEEDVHDPSSMVAEFYVSLEDDVRTLDEVSMWEQMSMAALLQRVWADNQVSCTVTFDPETEGDQIAHALDYFQFQLKGISFLPRSEDRTVYEQAPYEKADPEFIREKNEKVKPIDFSRVIDNEPEPDKYCSGKSCRI